MIHLRWPTINLDKESDFSQPTLVPVPQGLFVDAFDELPEQDRQRIKRDGQAAVDAFDRAYAVFVGVWYPMTESNPTFGIERMDPIAGATRVLVGMFADTGQSNSLSQSC